MMTKLCCDVLTALAGKTLATAESCTGGMLGAALTAVPGASRVYKGGIISYCSEIKARLLEVRREDLCTVGPVSAEVAAQMAAGARKALQVDFALSVTGLAGPEGDEFGRPVGTVFVGLAGDFGITVQEYHFEGDRNSVRTQSAEAALQMLMSHLRG